MQSTFEAKTISQENSSRILSLRFLLIGFVVIQHNSTGVADVFNATGTIFGPEWIYYFKSFITCGIVKANVPLCFIFSSYLLNVKWTSYKECLKKRVVSLLIPYTIWFFIYVFAFYLLNFIPVANYFYGTNNLCTNWSLLQWFKKYSGYGEIFRFPLVFQFWYIRDFLILVLLTPVFRFICKKTWAVLLCFVVIFYCVDFNFVIFGNSSILFYTIGMIFAMKGIDFFKLCDKIPYYFAISLHLVLLFLFVCVSSLNTIGKNVLTMFLIIFSCIIVLKFSKNIINSPKMFLLSKRLARYSFFMYAAHAPILLYGLRMVGLKFYKLEGIGVLLDYIIPTVICIVICVSAGFLLNKICPKVYKLLCGNR